MSPDHVAAQNSGQQVCDRFQYGIQDSEDELPWQHQLLCHFVQRFQGHLCCEAVQGLFTCQVSHVRPVHLSHQGDSMADFVLFVPFFFSPEATAYLTVFWLKVTPVPPWDLPTLSLSDMRESTCFTKIQPICPFAPPPPQTQAESRDTFKAAVGSDPILLHNNLTPDCNTLPLLWLAFIPRHIPAVGCWSRREYSLWFQLYNVASLHLDSETAAFHPQYFQFFLFPGPILRPQPPKTSSAKWNKFSLCMRFMLSETHCSIFSSQNSEFYKCFWSTYVKKIYTSCADRPCWSQIYWVALTPFKLLNLTRNFNISR